MRGYGGFEGLDVEATREQLVRGWLGEKAGKGVICLNPACWPLGSRS